MIKPTVKVEFAKNSDYYVWATHTFYDTTVESQNPPILKQYRRLNIQWQNIWSKVKSIFTPPNLVWNPYAPYHWQRGAISLVGSPYLNDDWTSAGDAEQTGVHGTIPTITIAGVDATGADILVFGASDDVNTHTMSSTYNSVSLTELVSRTDNRCAFLQYLGSPTQSSNTFVGTFSTASNGFGIICLYSGTAGTMSNGVSGQASSTNTSGQGETVTTTNGDLAVDVLTIGTAASSITIGGGQTQRGSNTSDAFYHEFRFSEEAATGSSVTMSWSWTTSSNFAHVSGKIDQASAGGTGGKFFFNM